MQLFSPVHEHVCRVCHNAQKGAYAGDNKDHGQKFSRLGLGGDISVPDCRDSHDAEIYCVGQ